MTNIEGLYEALQRGSPYNSSNIDQIESSLLSSLEYYFNRGVREFSYGSNEILVMSESDLPTPVNGYHKIPADTVLNFKGNITLENGLEFLGNGMIKGTSSETSYIISNIDTSLIKSAYSLPIQNISFTTNGEGALFELDGNGVDNAHDWYFVNFYGTSDLGTITDVSNWLIFGCAIFSSGNGFVFDGALGTGAISQCLFSGNYSTAITITEDATISRRFRTIYSSFIIASTKKGFDVSQSATIPVEGYILDSINFSGSGTYITGVTSGDNKARFQNCRGITNTASVGTLYMQQNATATVISQTLTYYKIAGTTTASSTNQRFNHANNRLTYVGAFSETFELKGTATLSGSANNEIGIVVFKNGQEASEFEVRSTLNTGGRAENISFFWVGTLSQNDYVEIYIENYTASSNVTVEDLVYIVNILR